VGGLDGAFWVMGVGVVGGRIIGWEGRALAGLEVVFAFVVLFRCTRQ